MEAGEVLGSRYRLVRKLGAGGMGEVWEAVHTVTTKRVALKLLHPTHRDRPDVRLRFLREARAAGRVRHPNVVSVHDVVELADGSPMMVMDFLSGETLSQKLAREKRFSAPELASLLRPVVDAISAAHSLGIIHRDLKPDNLFLDRQGDGALTIKVLDFGIAKLATLGEEPADALTRTGTMIGTPYYMSPEQAYGESDLDQRSDIWSLGIIAYECITGDKPTRGDNMGQILKRITAEPILPLEIAVPGTPAALSDVVQAMLSRPREGRPPLDHVAAVLAAIEGVGTSVRPADGFASTVSAVYLGGATSPSASTVPSSRRTKWVALAAFGLPLAVTLGGFGLLSARRMNATRDSGAATSSSSTAKAASEPVGSAPPIASSASIAESASIPASSAPIASATPLTTAGASARQVHSASSGKPLASIAEPARSAVVAPRPSTPSVGKLHEDVPF